MEDKIIDLTTPPTPDFVLDADEEVVPISSNSTQTDTQAEVSHEQEDKRPRRKKRKRILAEGDSQSIASLVRENCVEDVETLRKRRQCSNGSLDSVLHHDEVQQFRENARHIEEQDHHRSHSPFRQHNSPVDGTTDLFFVDLQPAPVAPFTAPSGTQQEKATPALLLPAHVSVLGTEPVDILPPTIVDPDEEDYIEYLDFDERKDLIRYFEDPAEGLAQKPQRTVCKNCGAEGDHKTSACPVLICLTCGARNEHATRSCPISKTCFTCGMKGHINATCPNRKAARMGGMSRYDDCDRCGSQRHKTNECPTLWRLYEYLTEEEKHHSLRTRRDKSNLILGEGGEGYIADDEWCYNCGSCGHWGDDCQDIPHQGNFPDEPSAFSTHNTLSGPFSDNVAELKPSTLPRRVPRDWELANDLPKGWGDNAPENVGRQARRNNIAKMEKRAKEQAIEDDPNDWFGKSRNAQNHRAPPSSGSRAPVAPKKISFGKSFQGAGSQFQPPSSAPSLLDRLGDNYHRGDSRSRDYERSRDSRPRNRPDRNYGSQLRQDNRYPERDKDRYRRRDETGPRYKGGYSR